MRYVTLDDGTRVYASGGRYRPKAPEDRVYAVRKPEDPRAVRYRGDWFLPLDVLPDEERGPVPETRPDSLAYEHAAKSPPCRCEPCQRPQAAAQRARWRRHQDARGG